VDLPVLQKGLFPSNLPVPTRPLPRLTHPAALLAPILSCYPRLPKTTADDEWPAVPSLISGTNNDGNTHNMKGTSSLSTALLALTLASGTVGPPYGQYQPKDSARQSTSVFPLVPNTTFVY